MDFFNRLSLSKKILIGILPLFVVFITLSVGLHNHFQEQEMLDQAQASAHTYADILRESMVSMMVNNLEVDESFIGRVAEGQQFDTLHILVNDLRLRQELLTPKRLKRIESKYRTLHPHDDIERKVLEAGEPVFLRKGDRFRGVIPFTATKVCQKCHAVPVGYVLGAADLHISFSRVEEAARGNWKRSIFIFVGFAFLAVGVATLIFRRFVSKPVDKLVHATDEISRGNLNYGISPAGRAYGDSGDEIAFLAGRFDEMRESLREKIHQLDHLNRDLSERNKQLEDALDRLRKAQEELVKSERLAVTGRMTAQLSHEINNPIHNIQSLLQTSLKKINGNAQASELIEVALDEVTRMAKLTRQMLDFYRGSVVEHEKVKVNIAALLEDLKKTTGEVLARDNIRITLVATEPIPYVFGSTDKLRQVFLNLVLNARDAMPGGGSITITVSSIPGAVRVDVADTGAGIAEEHLKKVFDAFFTTKQEVSGVGLGLSVSYGIIQQHKGTIEVKSRVGQGTLFTITLPSIQD